MVLWALVFAGAPAILGRLVFVFFQTHNVDDMPKLDFVEFFSGRKAITRALQKSGYRCASYELADDALREDFTTPAGFCYALQLLLRVQEGGGIWAAIVCSSWVRISSAISNRKVQR